MCKMCIAQSPPGVPVLALGTWDCHRKQPQLRRRKEPSPSPHHQLPDMKRSHWWRPCMKWPRTEIWWKDRGILLQSNRWWKTNWRMDENEWRSIKDNQKANLGVLFGSPRQWFERDIMAFRHYCKDPNTSWCIYILYIPGFGLHMISMISSVTFCSGYGRPTFASVLAGLRTDSFNNFLANSRKRKGTAM